MKRMFWAALVALAVPAAADAQVPGCSSCAAGGAIAPPMPSANSRPMGWYGGQGPFGCHGFCFKFFGTMLQDGPLVNYGPYEGYYPFEPYGPWTSDLRYTGPTARPGHGFNPTCNGGNCGHLGGGVLSRGLFHKRECGHYALATFRNVFQRVKPHCGGCGY